MQTMGPAACCRVHGLCGTTLRHKPIWGEHCAQLSGLLLDTGSPRDVCRSASCALPCLKKHRSSVATNCGHKEVAPRTLWGTVA